MPRTYTPVERDTVPAAPFIAWIEEMSEKMSRLALAQLVGQSERWVWRYHHSLDGMGRPTDKFPRDSVEDALNRAGVMLWELYPDVDEDVEVRERYCASCDETVMVDADDHCLWCCWPTAHVPEKQLELTSVN